MFRKVLVAERGVDAVRIVQACRELGIQTVAVHNRADADSWAVRLADEAFDIGRAQADPRPHLYIPAVLSACLLTGAEAVHPGYGPFSRDPAFAEVCADYRIAFIGPGPEALAHLDDAARIKDLMRSAGLPTVPGPGAPLASFPEVDAAALRIGYPVVLRPAGGGRGPAAVVRRRMDLEAAYAALRQHGRGRGLDLEQFIEPARRVEVQVLCDRYGRGVSLGEYDCSALGQDLGLIAESPSTSLTPERRREVCRLAVRGALVAGYVGVGTVEFLIDPDGRFYFAGLNTQARIDYAITEVTSGIDLIQEQIRVAVGEPLRFVPEGIRPRGHALRCHIEAAAAGAAVAPNRATIRTFIPASGPGIRVDTYIQSGCSVPPFYDPLVAQVIAWSEDRPRAINRMARALSEITIDGIPTTIPLLRRVFSDPAFRDGTPGAGLKLVS